jgi:hypothetical protein
MQQKPLTPLSAADFSSPLADARAEITRLRKELDRLKQFSPRDGTRSLDIQLRCAAYKKFIDGCGLTAEFKKQNPAAL